METVHCSLCGSENYSIWIHSTSAKDTSALFDIVECNSCGFKFTNPRPTYNEISRYYGENYYSHRVPARRLVRQGGSQENKPTFLDYGCGAGHKMIQKINEGFEAFGVEIDEKSQNIGAVLGLNILKSSKDKIDFTGEFFDEIHINNVLEHLHNPAAILSEAYRCLKSGGRLWAEVPNIESYDAKLYGAFWRHLDVPLHLNHFGPKTLESLFQHCGFGNFFLTTRYVPPLCPELHYVSGLYTTMKSKFKTSHGPAVERLAKSLWFVLSRYSKYIFHKKSKCDGNLLQVIAVKE